MSKRPIRHCRAKLAQETQEAAAKEAALRASQEEEARAKARTRCGVEGFGINPFGCCPHDAGSP